MKPKIIKITLRGQYYFITVSIYFLRKSIFLVIWTCIQGHSEFSEANSDTWNSRNFAENTIKKPTVYRIKRFCIFQCSVFSQQNTQWRVKTSQNVQYCFKNTGQMSKWVQSLWRAVGNMPYKIKQACLLTQWFLLRNVT